MSLLSPLWVPAMIVVALLAVRLMAWLLNLHLIKGRFVSIDGLRGYLAFFVFLHHCASWSNFLQTRQWDFPPSRLYVHLGPTSVSLFFMITAFLFIGKLIDTHVADFDWTKLYISRFLRIMPLYLLLMCLMLLAIAVISDFAFHEPALIIVKEIATWLIFIRVNINSVQYTKLITCGVVWSLAFEWLFYFSLPFFSLFNSAIRVRLGAFAVAIIGIIVLSLGLDSYSSDLPYLLLPFLSGGVAAFLARKEAVCRIARTRWASLCIMACFTLTVLCFNFTYEPGPLILLSIGFTGIACGNELFGILTSYSSRLLGQISYSIYLLHGIVLFTVLSGVIGDAYAARLGVGAYWSVMGICAVAVVAISCISYKWVELPGINAAGAVNKKIHNLLRTKRPSLINGRRP